MWKKWPLTVNWLNKFDYFTSNQQFCLLPIGRISLELASYLLIQGLQEMWAPCCNRSQIPVKWSCWMTTCITAACDAWLAQDTSGLRTLVHAAWVFCILEMNDSFARTMKSHGFWWSSLVFECLTLRKHLEILVFLFAFPRKAMVSPLSGASLFLSPTFLAGAWHKCPGSTNLTIRGNLWRITQQKR